MKQTLKHSLRLFGYLLFAEFASIVLVSSFLVIFAKASKWIFYLFSQSFSFVLLFAVIWGKIYDIGFRDSNMVRTGHRAEDLYKGFKIGAFAQMPFFILFVASVVFNFKFALYRLLNCSYYWFLTAIAGNNQNMQMGIFKIIGMALLFLIVPAISGTAYILGYKGIDLYSKFIYKKRRVK